MCLLPVIKKMLCAALAAAGIFVGGGFALADSPRPILVMIDPGHGGCDAGAVGPKEAAPKKGAKPPHRLVEKKIALQLAKLLGEQLESRGCAVQYTRTADVDVPLYDRSRAANEIGADIFVSLHFNANANKKAKGSEVYFLSMGPVEQYLQDLAKAENEHGDFSSGGSGEIDFVAGILDDLAQYSFLQESERMAVFIQSELNRLDGIRERGVKQAPFAVLRTAAMPAVLVETAFISNPLEAAKLRDPAFLKSAAQAIANGIQFYIDSAGNGRVRRKTSILP
jgi:N-acetylmuramoyl-L-alanine amidase